MRYYSDMIPTLVKRASSGALSSFGFSNSVLRAYLKEQFNKPIGEDGCFVGDPAFEAVFGWKTSDKRIEELEEDLLHPDLAAALDKGDLKKHFYPYTHQEKAWRILGQDEPQSVIISSGTGSGKTECFMIPILNRLIQEYNQTNKQLTGVRTLFLYPLNALINSQRERLNLWTQSFKRNIRFCLYNGLTPERMKKVRRRETPNEVRDRKSLRKNPPPILVTNPTMLEYMLVRAKDNPIIEQSKGLLDTIVLDEAHTYIGSQAAEMTLLLRRVLHAFGKKPSEVRFVATSATIGEEGDKGKKNLKSFMQQISGVNSSKVHVIEGERKIPQLKVTESNNKSLQDFENIENSEKLYDELEKNETARKIRSLFTKNKNAVAKLSQVSNQLYGKNSSLSLTQQKNGLRWLDVLTGAKSEEKGAFLPLRAHIFQKTFPGIWACADSECSEKEKHHLLNDKDWPFGKVYLQNQRECACGAPVYEVVSCKECGEVYLDIEISGNKVIQPAKDENFDEFELEVENDPEAIIDDEGSEETVRTGNEALLVKSSLHRNGKAYINRDTREYSDRKQKNSFKAHIKEYINDPNGLPCPNCQDSSKVKYKRFRGHTIGAPSLLNVLLPTLLQYGEEENEDTSLPFNGRRLLTFNDSRQGTARIAAKLQQDSERSKARGLIYHNILKNGRRKNEAEVESLEEEIKKLEHVAADSLAGMIQDKKKELEKLKSFNSISYQKLKRLIAKEDGDFVHIVNR